MQVVPSVLALVGSLCMTIALILAWCLTTGFMKRWFPSYQYLVKSHIDYLMMTGLLFIFFLLFTDFQGTRPALIIVGMCVGSLVSRAAYSGPQNSDQAISLNFGGVVTQGEAMATTRANRLSVRSPRTASNATLALNFGLY